MHEMSHGHNMYLKEPDRDHETDLATLRKKRAELKAYLQSLSHITPQETTRKHAEAVLSLMDIESDISEIERGKRFSGKPSHGMRERMDSIDFDRYQSRAGGRVDQSTYGDRESEYTKYRNTRTEGRQPGGSGYGSRRPVAEADIASTAQDLPRLGFESRESAQMPVGRRPSSHYDDLADFAGEESDYQIRGSRSGHQYPPSGHGQHSSRYPNDAMTPPWYCDNQYYAAGMSEYQLGGSRNGPYLPPAGHGHSGRHACRFPGR